MSFIVHRVAKQAARYTPGGGREKCGLCRFFVPPVSCGKVIGPVSAMGWCKYFSREMVQQFGGSIVAGGGATFDQSFMSGSLGAGAVFTRASAGWYTNASGTLVSAAINTPRFDYDPVTLQLKGVLLEDASTNLVLQSGNLSAAPWSAVSAFGPAAPVVTGNNAVAPDGTTTAARIVLPAVSAGGLSEVQQNVAISTAFAFSVWLRGAVGGEQTYIHTFGAVYTSLRVTLTTAWQRYSIAAPANAAGNYLVVGTDLRDGSQTATPAGTIYAWGGQAEANYASSYIPTLGASATRAADLLSYPIASVTGFDTTKGTLLHEYIVEGTAPTFGAPAAFIGANSVTDYINVDEATVTGAVPPGFTLSVAVVSSGGTARSTCFFTQVPVPANVIHRGAHAWSLTALPNAAHDGVASVSTNQIPASLPTITNLIVAGQMHSQFAISQWARGTSYWPRQLSQAELITVTT